MIKKILSIVLTIALLLSFSACGVVGSAAEVPNESALISDKLTMQGKADKLSETEITELADRLMQEAKTVFWWYHSDMSEELGIDIEEKPLQAYGSEWQRVGRFKTMKELKAATEAVFTLDFCKEHFYDKIEQHNKFKEIGGALYHNANVGGMGWIYSLPKEYIVQSADKDKIVLTAICDGLISGTKSEAEYEFELTMLRDSGGWKVNSYYNYTAQGVEGDLLLKDGLNVYGDDIENIAEALLGAGMLGETWTEPWTEESVSDQSLVRFYCMMNPDYKQEIPAKDFELFMHGSFDISTEHIRQIDDYNADKKVYEVSVDVSVPMMQAQADEYFKIDSIVQKNGKINLSYRTLWGNMAAEGDGSDTVYAGVISFRSAGRFFPVESVTVTEDYSDKYD